VTRVQDRVEKFTTATEFTYVANARPAVFPMGDR